MRHFPLRECGFAVGFVVVLATIYVGSYYATVRRQYFPPMSATWIENGTEDDYERLNVHPIYRPECSRTFYSPMYEIDRKLRPDYWSSKEAKKEEDERFKAMIDEFLRAAKSRTK
jgi:hypothetical protein